MGLCASLAVADFKPICWEKIGLVYHPSFIVHIVFANPTNYIFPPVTFFSPVFPLLPTQTQAKTKDTTTVRIEYSCKMPTTVSVQTKESLITQKALAMKQPEEDHMALKRTGDNPAVTWNYKTLFCFSSTFSLCLSLSFSHTHTKIMISCPPL